MHAIAVLQGASMGVKPLQTYYETLPYKIRRLTSQQSTRPAPRMCYNGFTKRYQILIGRSGNFSLDRLPEAFAELDAAQRAEDMADCEADRQSCPDEEVLSRSMPHQDRALIRSEALHAWIQSATRSRAPTVALSARGP